MMNDDGWQCACAVVCAPHIAYGKLKKRRKKKTTTHIRYPIDISYYFQSRI